MKLATKRSRHRDGQLIVVSKDLLWAADASRIASTMQDALDRWQEVERDLAEVYRALNEGAESSAFPLDFDQLTAPLPRAWQWLDGSAYPSHAALMTTAFGIDPLPQERPLMYQGMSHYFAGPRDDIYLPSVEDGIDFEAEFAVVTGDVPMGLPVDRAGETVRLIVMINDWSLRVTGATEMKSGFGWVQAKPACSMAPIALTPDEFGEAWRSARLDLTMNVSLNNASFGSVRSNEMAFGFDELIAHAAATRSLCAGTIIGSGTVSSAEYEKAGSCCIAERRASEIVKFGEPRTGFLQFGDEVQVAATEVGKSEALFGILRQKVVQANRP